MNRNFDVLRFVRDYNIQTADGDSKHYRNDWVNIECPFCEGNPGFHLGYNIDSDYWNCWRCGGHHPIKAIQMLLNISWNEALKLFKVYGGRPTAAKEKEERETPSSIKLPTGTGPMQKQHKQYLINRNFDPESLEKEWGLLGTGPVGRYKFRIIAPIFHNNKLVSYQGRDITDRAKLKYKACAGAREILPHKETLYGIDKAKGSLSVVVVEGITDAWRLGPGAVSTFGIEWTMAQALLLLEFPRVFIMYDFAEVEAKKQSRNLAYTLSGLGVSVERLISSKGDPAELPQDEATKLMKEIN